jgi:hypothetical protein
VYVVTIQENIATSVWKSVLGQGELDKILKLVLEEWGVSMYPDLLLSKIEFPSSSTLDGARESDQEARRLLRTELEAVLNDFLL